MLPALDTDVKTIRTRNLAARHLAELRADEARKRAALIAHVEERLFIYGAFVMAGDTDTATCHRHAVELVNSVIATVKHWGTR